MHRLSQLLTVLTAGVFGFLLPLAAEGQGTGDLQIAELGECPLESGEVIRGCRLGYRVFGELNAEGTNAILAPTPFMGTSHQLVSMIRPTGLAENPDYFLVLVDAFGNGVSSSPSNSAEQSGDAFPGVTIRDMVAAEYRLLTEVLGVHSLHAIIGISMGGMQGWEWATEHPVFVRRLVSVLSSPRLATYDVVLWKTLEDALRLYIECECEEAARVVGGLGFLVGNSPDFHARRTPRDSLAGTLARMADQTLTVPRARDITSQLRAMIGHDISAPFEGSLALAAAHIETRVQIIVSPVDHVVTPGPAMEIAGILDAELIELGSDCGHNGMACDAMQAGMAILRFLTADE